MPDPGHVVEGIFVDPYPCERVATTAEEAQAYFRDALEHEAGVASGRIVYKWEGRIFRDTGLAPICAKFLRSLSLEVGAGLPGVRG